jgi:uncharacterized protein YceK
MKTLKMLMLGFILAFSLTSGLSGCATLSTTATKIQSDPATQAIAGMALSEATQAVLKNNPQLKPQVISTVTVAIGLLNNSASITHQNVVSYVQGVVNAYPGLPIQAKEMLDVIAQYYIPASWSGSSVQLTADEKAVLLNALQLILASAQN